MLVRVASEIVRQITLSVKRIRLNATGNWRGAIKGANAAPCSMRAPVAVQVLYQYSTVVVTLSSFRTRLGAQNRFVLKPLYHR